MRLPQTICFAVCASIAASSAALAAELTKEPLSEIKQKIDDEKGVLVDVREKTEWQEGHVEGAIFLPVSRLRDGVTQGELKALPKDKDKILYVHCVVGKRALSAGEILEKHGYTVRPMKPGYKQMIAAGFPDAKD